MEETIRVVIKKPYQPAYEDNIKNDLHTFYKIINCDLIEMCSLPIDRDISMIIDDNGKMFGRTGNFIVPEFRDCILGTCIFSATDESGDNISLTDKQVKTINDYLKDYELHNGEDIYFHSQELIEKAVKKMRESEVELWLIILT